MAQQTREQHWQECKDKKLPLPEIVRGGDIAHIDGGGNKMLVRDEDINSTDVRDIDANGVAGPWRRAPK